MKRNNDDSSKLILGLLISGAVAAGIAVACRKRVQNEHRPLYKLGKTISQIGQMLETCSIDKSASEVIETVEKKISRSDVVDRLTSWLDTSVNVWKTLKKG
jgi:t-SNARE complex subunit (syntaxin)